jgi:hypothetical protein
MKKCRNNERKISCKTGRKVDGKNKQQINKHTNRKNEDKIVKQSHDKYAAI